VRGDYDVEVARIVLGVQPDLVVLAGWMHVLGERFLDALSGTVTVDGVPRPACAVPVINLHPALPGAFDGANAIERTYEAFQRGEVAFGGAMVHRVIKEVDRGEPLVVRQVEIRPSEPVESFEERLHRTEWEIIVEGTRKALEEARYTRSS
jgi:phosphoribosylglycinamide formyltransferase